MLDLDDIQAIVFSGHGNMPHARFLFLQVKDKKKAQAWISAILPAIVPATRRARGAPKPPAAAHIAFTCSGMAALGLDSDSLNQFPREFTEGMSLGQRPRALGDTGASAPETWQFGGPNNPDVHILLALYSESAAKMEALLAEPWYPGQTAPGVTVLFDQESYRQTDNEPFGFRDGISQPVIAGSPASTDDNAAAISPGEFLLGYMNEYANLSPAPTVAPQLDPGNTLPADATDATRRSFGMNGTFMVVRKLAQDVEGFWKFCEQNTLNRDGTPDIDAKIAFAAKLVGRWPSGCPLTLSPDKDIPSIGADNKQNNSFQFTPRDADGYSCPVGSHVRRSNPRDSLHPNAPARSINISNRHRIVRRGRPYVDAISGATVSNQSHGSSASNPETGLVFIALNADLQRQFEFVQQTWLNNPTFNGLFNDSDPLVSHNDGPGTMTIQRRPVRKTIQDVPAFVSVRGGGYFFLPGIRAIRFLAGLP